MDEKSANEIVIFNYEMSYLFRDEVFVSKLFADSL